MILRQWLSCVSMIPFVRPNDETFKKETLLIWLFYLFKIFSPDSNIIWVFVFIVEQESQRPADPWRFTEINQDFT